MIGTLRRQDLEEASTQPAQPAEGPPDPAVEALRAIVGPRGLVLGDEARPYFKGARYGDGRALCVVRPASADEVSRVVRLCAAHRLRIVPQGANTGLVGASSPDGSGTQIVLSLIRLRHRCELDPVNRTVDVDAGVLLHELNERLDPHGLWFPVDLAADPSVGGMVSSNTGGTRLLKYGDVRHNLLAVEAVLFDPPGEIVRFGRPLRKNNTGFDLMQLFVGTSGAVGVITGATLEVAAQPRQSVSALLVPACDEAALALLTAAESELGDFLSAFEGISGAALTAALDHLPSLRNPFGSEAAPEFSLLIELTSCSPVGQGVDLERALVHFLEDRLGHELSNAVLGRGDEFWQLRHALSDGARALGQVIGFDVSVRRSDVMRFRLAAKQLVTDLCPGFEVVDFGHVGDGGLHFNLVWPRQFGAYDADTVERLRDRIYELVVGTFQGSYSAEHGVGPHNHAYYLRYTAPAALRWSGHLQRLLDPRGLCGTVQLGEPATPVLHA
jgi:FAD/FMN-containing dehydrogenase